MSCWMTEKVVLQLILLGIPQILLLNIKTSVIRIKCPKDLQIPFIIILKLRVYKDMERISLKKYPFLAEEYSQRIAKYPLLSVGEN